MNHYRQSKLCHYEPCNSLLFTLYSLLSTLYSLLSTPLTENPADKVGRPCPTPLIYDSIPLVDMLVVLGFQSELVLGLLLSQGLKYFLKLGTARRLDQVIVKI